GAPATSAVIALLAIALGGGQWVWYSLVVLTLLVCLAVERRPELGTQVAPRLALVAAVTGYAAAAGERGWLAAGGALLAGVLLAESPVRRLARPWYRGANLAVRPGLAATLVTDGTAW